MPHLIRNEAWALIDLDTEGKRIFVREDWAYRWTVGEGQSDWTADEQVAFHRAIDRAIWSHWSRSVRLQARAAGSVKFAGPSSLARLSGQTFTVTFDVRMVRAKAHWQVSVQKTNPKIPIKPQPQVDFHAKTISLFTTDLLVTKAKRAAGEPWHLGFSAPGHEFGHTIGNSGPLGDEYVRGVPGYDDTDSIMNVGHQLRSRHLKLLCETLHAMVPGCEFIPLLP